MRRRGAVPYTYPRTGNCPDRRYCPHAACTPHPHSSTAHSQTAHNRRRSLPSYNSPQPKRGVIIITHALPTHVLSRTAHTHARAHDKRCEIETSKTTQYNLST